jgi:hypothetical protein
MGAVGLALCVVLVEVEFWVELANLRWKVSWMLVCCGFTKGSGERVVILVAARLVTCVGSVNVRYVFSSVKEGLHSLTYLKHNVRKLRLHIKNVSLNYGSVLLPLAVVGGWWLRVQERLFVRSALSSVIWISSCVAVAVAADMLIMRKPVFMRFDSVGSTLDKYPASHQIK